MGLNSNDPRSYGTDPKDIEAKVAAALLGEDLGGVTEEGTGVPGKVDLWSRKEEERGVRLVAIWLPCLDGVKLLWAWRV